MSTAASVLTTALMLTAAFMLTTVIAVASTLMTTTPSTVTASALVLAKPGTARRISSPLAATWTLLDRLTDASHHPNPY